MSGARIFSDVIILSEAMAQKLKSAGLIILFFVLWECACIVFGVKEIILPRPTVILSAMYEFFPGIKPHLIQTLYTTLVGFALGVVVGVALGLLIGTSRVAYDTAYPLLVGFSSIPKVAVVPIFGSVRARRPPS
jgi:NitT/TauT family transport system permease protein